MLPSGRCGEVARFMIEVQCPSCQTRYRIDEGVLPQDTPTFKCSRFGHVFSGDPRLAKRPPLTRPKPIHSGAKPSAPAQPHPPSLHAAPPPVPPPTQAPTPPSPRL